MCSTLFRRRELVHYCSQEKETGVLLFKLFKGRNLMLYCSQEKETGALLFSRRKPVL